MLWHLAKHQHLALVRLAGLVALETVFIAALLVAHLAVPTQLLQALGLDAVRNLQLHQSTIKLHGSLCSTLVELCVNACYVRTFFGEKKSPFPAFPMVGTLAGLCKFTQAPVALYEATFTQVFLAQATAALQLNLQLAAQQRETSAQAS